MSAGASRVEGLNELLRACKASEKEVRLGVRAKLREAGEPVRARTEELAVSNISHVGSTWSRMRVGVTAREVYVAPRARRRAGSPRPNLGGLLMRKAMSPALDQKRDEVVSMLEHALDEIADRNW